MAVLAGKVAIITGASSGIGRATARLFAREGAAVVVSARRQTELAELVAEIADDGGRAVAVSGDVRDEDHARELVDVAIHAFGSLDIAFNNVGASGAMGPVSDIPREGWQETLDTNLTSAYLGAKHQVPAMLAQGGGSLVFTSSFVGNGVGFPGMAAYAAAKAGLCGLAQVLAAEYGPHGIRANTLLPGAIDTPANHANAPESGPEVHQFIEGLHALRRLGTPDEVACAALFLASDAAAFVTGAALRVDGGVSVTRT